MAVVGAHRRSQAYEIGWPERSAPSVPYQLLTRAVCKHKAIIAGVEASRYDCAIARSESVRKRTRQCIEDDMVAQRSGNGRGYQKA